MKLPSGKKLHTAGFLALLLAAALCLSACGAGSGSSDAASAAESTAKSTSAEAQENASEESKEPAASDAESSASSSDAAAESTDSDASDDASAAGDASEENGSDTEPSSDAENGSGTDIAPAPGDVHPYAWLGMTEMPSCRYMDLVSSAHYTWTYDYYLSGYVIEQTEAIDLINTYKQDAHSRSYSVNGLVLSINEDSKIYMEMDAGSAAQAARAEMEAGIANGTNLYMRAFVGTGSEPVPLYSDGGDTTAYEYYEFNYPESTAQTGAELNERYYMKDGDVFAIYSKSVMNGNTVEATQVIKSMSGEIPPEYFEFPDLTEYTKYG